MQFSQLAVSATRSRSPARTGFNGNETERSRVHTHEMIMTGSPPIRFRVRSADYVRPNRGDRFIPYTANARPAGPGRFRRFPSPQSTKCVRSFHR